MQMVEVHAKGAPTNLLKKDWVKRKNYFFENSKPFLDRVHDMKLRDDDVWLVSLSKCGTTWMQELLWLVMNDFDFKTAKSVGLEKRAPFLEFSYMVHQNVHTALEPVEKLKSPRLIKTHLALPLLPAELWNRKFKVIYVYRHPIDAWLSLYHHFKSLGMFTNLVVEDFFNMYMNFMSKTDLPFEHVTEFYALRNEPWIYYTSFERMKLDLEQEIQEISDFLGKSINEQQMQQMLHHLSFEEMKNNPMTSFEWEFNQMRSKFDNNYENHNCLRKGKSGGYKEELTPQLIERIDKFIQNNLEPFNITLDELLLLK